MDNQALQPHSKVLREARDRSKDPRADDQTLLVSVTRACKYLGVSKTKLYELMHQHRVDGVQIGKSRRFTMSSIVKYVDQLVAEARAKA